LLRPDLRPAVFRKEAKKAEEAKQQRSIRNLFKVERKTKTQVELEVKGFRVASSSSVLLESAPRLEDPKMQRYNGRTSDNVQQQIITGLLGGYQGVCDVHL